MGSKRLPNEILVYQCDEADAAEGLPDHLKDNAVILRG